MYLVQACSNYQEGISSTGYLTYRLYAEHINLLGEYVFDQRTIAKLDAFQQRNSSGFQMVIS